MHKDLIIIDPKVCHGKPIFRGTRIMVSNVLSQLAGGYDFEKIKKGYPEISDEHIRAALEYATQLVADEDVHLAPAA